MWLSYSQDEVAAFHPAFQAVATSSLITLGLESTYEWLHHPKTVGVGVVPDFVLVERASGRWIVIVEIKRRPDVVDSERSQIQAKGYAEANASMYNLGHPVYFAISNLEVTHLFALRGSSPPKDCRIENASFDSGRFASTPEPQHRQALADDICKMVRFCLDVTQPSFSTVWPQIVRSAYDHAEGLPFSDAMDAEPGSVPDSIRSYFSVDAKRSLRREMLIRCLLVEYVRGLLRKHGHPRENTLAPIGSSLAGAANAMSQLSSIDFSGVIEKNSPSMYLGFEKFPAYAKPIERYLDALHAEDVAAHAATRTDSHTLTTTLIEESAPAYIRDARGKAATDPELAALLVAMAITHAGATVLDPCCGEGNLLSAAYDRLKGLGASHAQSLAQISGVEADSLAAKIAALRLALKEPRLAKNTDPCNIFVRDMFGMREAIARADVVVMNPPFKRYEAQDDAPLPPAIRNHIRAAITEIDGTVSTDQGQSNLYNLYVEFAVRAAAQGTTLAIVLDNKWFHNGIAKNLRAFLLTHCQILGVLTYPHERFFEGLMIATSMMVIRKQEPTFNQKTYFIRVQNPGSTSSDAAAAALRGGPAPPGWSIKPVSQQELTSESWKAFFSTSLLHEFRTPPLTHLPALFRRGRRGSLAKEGGGIAVYEFPQDRSEYGPRRDKKINGGPFQTEKGDSLTAQQNAKLRALAEAIPSSCLGYAINKADRINRYILNTEDVMRDRTIEIPAQRSSLLSEKYATATRVRWTDAMDELVDEICGLEGIAEYVQGITEEVGLDESVLPRSQLWNALREPYAGELIIPRKAREGHRVHINPFAFRPYERQVRLSSNFLSYGECVATDTSTALTRESATLLIAAWLMSSFGHLQFELESNNREGLRSAEQHHVEKIWVVDPRNIRPQKRDKIIEASQRLPYPIRTDLRPNLQDELVELDTLFAEELGNLLPSFNPTLALAEVWDLLHEMHEARNN